MRYFGVLAAMILVFASANGAVADSQRQFVGWVNELREQNGLQPVRANKKLEVAAQRHADDMLRKGFFGHTGSDGSAHGDRARRAGYRFCVIGENIAMGQKSASQVMNGWTKSPPHRKNMLLKRASDIGVARSSKDHWVMVLAAPYGSC